MLSENDYKIIFDEYNLDYEIITKDYILFYDSVINFLKHHKKTGARYTSNNKPAGKKAFNAFLQLYSDIFGTEKGIPVTYSIIYVTGRKKEL
jgi:malonyl-CoA O-methyltransferase